MKRFLFCVLFLSSSAYAGMFSKDGQDLDEPCLVYDSDSYFGVAIGKSKPSAFGHPANGKTFMAGGVFLGHRFNRRWAVEGSYLNLGTFPDSTANQATALDTFSVELVRRFAVDDYRYFSLYLKGGYAATRISLQPVGSAWHSSVAYGGGIEITASDPEDRLWYLRIGATNINTGSLTPISPGTYVPNDSVLNYGASLIFNY
ncbi:MAG: outer membrane beta-barrel protein [Halothiobacillaceae bacterium]|nr:outer membrane beta-barrel protein [Halothiobacillaceae bacterium]